MTCEELIEYLSGFEPDTHVAFVVADIQKRLHYKISGVFLIDELPAVMLETTEPGPLDNLMEQIEDEIISGSSSKPKGLFDTEEKV